MKDLDGMDVVLIVLLLVIGFVIVAGMNYNNQLLIEQEKTKQMQIELTIMEETDNDNR